MWGMNYFQSLRSINAGGLDALASLAGLTIADGVALGLPKPRVSALLKAHDGFFSSTQSTRKQRDAHEAARRNRHAVDTLLMTDARARSLKDSRRAWDLRLQLCRMTGSYADIDAAAKQLVDEWNGPHTRAEGVRISRSRNGQRTMSITADERFLAELEHTLDARVADGDSRPRSEALLDAFRDTVTDGGIVEPKYQPVIAIGLDDSVELLHGRGDDIVLGCSDGTTMTGEEFLGLKLTDHVYAGLFHPVHGPVNLYETRFASWKMRQLAKAESLVCPWPGCKTPADQCQTHHLRAHKHGGETTPPNLAKLCGFHNGFNDDDHENLHGRLVRLNGHLHWRSPGGRNLRNDHPLMHLGAMSLI